MPPWAASTSRTRPDCRCTARPTTACTTPGPNPCAAGRTCGPPQTIIRPALVVIDPALDAYTGDPNNLAAVREFVSALGAEAAARSCGVLLVAHSRKAARGKDSDPFDPGQVGGVGAWADAARGVLTLTGQGDNRTLAIAKANWGRAYVLAQLAPVSNDAGALIGFDTDGWSDKAQEQTYDSTT